jgi:hypothetical protein
MYGTGKRRWRADVYDWYRMSLRVQIIQDVAVNGQDSGKHITFMNSASPMRATCPGSVICLDRIHAAILKLLRLQLTVEERVHVLVP